MIRLISACCLTLVLAACGNAPGTPAGAATGAPPADAAADEAAIRAADEAWFTAFNAGDADAVVALYSVDAVVAAPGVPADRGSAAIRERMTKDIEGMRGGGLKMVRASSADAGASGDLGWVGNSFTVQDKSGATVDAGKYVTLMARKDGKWQIIRDIWNSDNPPAPPAKGTD